MTVDIFDLIAKEDRGLIDIPIVRPGAAGFSDELDLTELSGYLDMRLPVIAVPLPEGGSFARTSVDGLTQDIYGDAIVDVVEVGGEDIRHKPTIERLNPAIAPGFRIDITTSAMAELENINFFPEGHDKVLFKPASMPYPSNEPTNANWLIASKPKDESPGVVLKDLTHISSDQLLAMHMFGLDTSNNEVAPKEEIEVKIFKEATDEDRRLVYGVVIRPNIIDGEDDTMVPLEVERTAHLYLAVHGVMGFRHKEEVKDAFPVESYIAPVDFEIGGNKVLKGDWVLVSFVKNDDLWQLIKEGKINGYSPGGVGYRRKVKI